MTNLETLLREESKSWNPRPFSLSEEVRPMERLLLSARAVQGT